MFEAVMEEVKAEWLDERANKTMEEYAAEVEKRCLEYLTKKWEAGFADRGHGHGNYAVLVEGTQIVVAECGVSPYAAERIANEHNLLLEIQTEVDTSENGNESCLWIQEKLAGLKQAGLVKQEPQNSTESTQPHS